MVWTPEAHTVLEQVVSTADFCCRSPNNYQHSGRNAPDVVVVSGASTVPQNDIGNSSSPYKK